MPPADSDAPDSLRRRVVDSALEMLGDSGRGGSVQVQGDSMEPHLREGQRVWGEFASRQPRRGDVLLFRQRDHIVVHRVLRRTRGEDGGPAWLTRGDGKLALDPLVGPGDVLGRVVAVEVAGRWRRLSGPAPRAYALALGFHGLCWSAVGRVALFAERRGHRLLGWRPPFFGLLARLDKAVLLVVHGVFFRALHRPCPPPQTAASEGPEEGTPAPTGGDVTP